MRAAILFLITAICVWALAPYLPSPTEVFMRETPTEAESPKVELIIPAEEIDLALIEQQVFDLINEQREAENLNKLYWDDELYSLSMAHTLKMAEKGEIFHSSEIANYAENCWGGTGYYKFNKDELAGVIVDTWMSSPLHRAWLLHEPLKTAVVSIVITPEGQFASWTFWKDEMGMGPDLVAKIAEEWERETSRSIPWIEWLYMKGYLD